MARGRSSRGTYAPPAIATSRRAANGGRRRGTVEAEGAHPQQQNQDEKLSFHVTSLGDVSMKTGARERRKRVEEPSQEASKFLGGPSGAFNGLSKIISAPPEDSWHNPPQTVLPSVCSAKLSHPVKRYFRVSDLSGTVSSSEESR